MHRRHPRRQKPFERVPVVAAIGCRFGVHAQSQRFRSIHQPKVRDEGRVEEQNGVPIRLEVRKDPLVAQQVIFVGIGDGRVVGLPQRLRDNRDRIGFEQVIGIDGGDVPPGRAFQTKPHPADDAQILFHAKRPHARIRRDAGQLGPRIGARRAIVEQNPFELTMRRLRQQALGHRPQKLRRRVPDRRQERDQARFRRTVARAGPRLSPPSQPGFVVPVSRHPAAGQRRFPAGERGVTQTRPNPRRSFRAGVGRADKSVQHSHRSDSSRPIDRVFRQSV